MAARYTPPRVSSASADDEALALVERRHRGDEPASQGVDVLVVLDDLALPYGSIRIRGKGSDAGHNGLKDIQAKLGRADYPRLRFGIGDNFSKGRQVDYVLGEWTAEEQKDLPALIEHCVKACQSFGLAGLSLTMNQFNKK